MVMLPSGGGEAAPAALSERTIAGLISALLADLPDTQAVYLYGSVASGTATAASDLDLGVLLPHRTALRVGLLSLSSTRLRVASLVGREVDLVNLRRVPIVLQKEVVAGGCRIHTADRRAAEEYEMLVLSFYGKLNEERSEILAELARTKRAYRV